MPNECRFYFKAEKRAKESYETRRIDSTDEEGFDKDIAEGYEPVPGLTVNGHIFLRKQKDP